MMTVIIASAVVALLVLPAGAAAQQPDSSVGSLTATPTAPQLRNAADLADELTEQYPLRLRNAAIGGSARVRLRVNEEGDVDSTWVAFSSGLFGLDRAALTTVKKAKFEPATMNGEATAMWTELPLTFRTGDERGPAPQALQVMNRAALEAALQAMMPDAMRKARIGARVGLDVTVDAAGNPTDFAILETSCLSDSDVRALEIASRLAFAPSSSSVPRRTYASVLFGKDSVSIRLLGDARPPRPRTESDTATTGAERVRERARPPRLRNRAGIARALEEIYPPDLRDQGIGGEAMLWVFVNEEGDVAFREIHTSSGECRFDTAALLVSEQFRFTPAVNEDGSKVAVWVAIPIKFTSR
ncbi:MAG: TonB family protein [Longimicrobiales bacterium]